MFKVVPDQLRISQGWVRCGQCEEVFDASTHLVDVLTDGAAPTQEATQAGATEVNDEAARPPSAGDDHSAHPLTESDVEPVAIEPVLEEFRVLDDADALSQSFSGDASDVDILIASDTVGLQAGAPDVSFVRGGATSDAFWQRPRVRATLWLTSFVLCVGLLMQVIVHERDRIAALEPGLKPLAEAVCVLAQCTISPLRQIDSVVIESSSFNKIRADAYRLNFTLKNTAPIHLALPAIELSVTDSQEQAIMRRVFMPGEFGIRTAVLPGGTESSGSIALSIKTNGNADRVAGYLIRTFYP